MVYQCEVRHHVASAGFRLRGTPLEIPCDVVGVLAAAVAQQVLIITAVCLECGQCRLTGDFFADRFANFWRD